MLMPSIFGENLFDDLFDFPFYDDRNEQKVEKKLYGRHARNLMKTDIKEMDNGYQLIIDLPGFKKEEIHAALENGYLTISAAKGLDEDEQEKESGHYIRRERYAGACERSFYVGDSISQEDIKAEFKHGILKLFVPRKKPDPLQKRTSISLSKGNHSFPGTFTTPGSNAGRFFLPFSSRYCISCCYLKIKELKWE